MHTYEVFAVLEKNTKRYVEVKSLDVKKLLDQRKYQLIRNGELFVGWKCDCYYQNGVRLYKHELIKHMQQILESQLKFV